MPAKHSPEQYAKRERQLLLHTRDFRLLTGFSAGCVFGDGTPIPHVLRAIADQGLLEGMPRSIPGGLSYFVLSEKGYARIGVTPPRTSVGPMQGSAFDLALGTEAFCCWGPVVRHRLSVDEQRELFGDAIPANVPVVISDELGDAKVFRVTHAISPSPMETIRKLRQSCDQLSRHEKLGVMVSQQQLGFALLAPTSASLRELEKAVRKSGIQAVFSVIVGLGPTAETLALAIKEFRGRKSS